jgi:hypothetical protein
MCSPNHHPSALTAYSSRVLYLIKCLVSHVPERPQERGQQTAHIGVAVRAGSTFNNNSSHVRR